MCTSPIAYIAQIPPYLTWNDIAEKTSPLYLTYTYDSVRANAIVAENKGCIFVLNLPKAMPYKNMHKRMLYSFMKRTKVNKIVVLDPEERESVEGMDFVAGYNKHFHLNQVSARVYRGGEIR